MKPRICPKYCVHDGSGLVRKTSIHSKVAELKGKIYGTAGLVTKTNFNTNVREIENKIADNTDFDTKFKNLINRVTSNKTKYIENGKYLPKYLQKPNK